MASIAVGVALALVALIHRLTRRWQVRGQLALQHFIADPLGIAGVSEKNALLTWWVSAVAIASASTIFVVAGIWTLVIG